VSGYLLERFLEAASRFPDRRALVTRDGAVTYASLARMVAAAAGVLSETGEPGGRIALLSESSPEYVAALYGAWAAGLGVVGLNPALSADELVRLSRHADVAATVIDPAHPAAPVLREHLGARVPLVDLGDATAMQDGPGRPERAPEPDRDDLAQIIYTSGTTGHPKGVMLSHGNLAANTASIQRSLPISEDDRAFCILPFQYSYGSSVLHTHLSIGATVLIERSLMYPGAVLQRMVSEAATSFAGVPSTFYLLLDRTRLSDYDLSSLRYVTQAGGHMDHARISTFRELVPSADFFVMYGQTEASARLACLPSSDLDGRPGSAGKAIPGVELSVRDQEGLTLSAGQEGELWARGENTMLGYWNDAEATASVLVDGWLKTGDIGRVDEDGYVFLTGRSREFIKSGAYRVAPAEIEDVIRSVEGVRDVAVVGRDDSVLGEAIHAHVIAAGPGPDLERAIMRACSDRLARFKLPKQIHFRNDFPKTASGKIRKHLL